MATAKYLRIKTNEFQNRLSAIFEPFEECEHKQVYEIVKTYEPLRIQEGQEHGHVETWNLLPALRKRGLTEKEKLLIDIYLKGHSH